MRYNTIKRNHLKEALTETGVKVAVLAKDIGVSRSMVYLYLDNSNQPSPDVADKICEFLGMKFNVLFEVG